LSPPFRIAQNRDRERSNFLHHKGTMRHPGWADRSSASWAEEDRRRSADARPRVSAPELWPRPCPLLQGARAMLANSQSVVLKTSTSNMSWWCLVMPR